MNYIQWWARKFAGLCVSLVILMILGLQTVAALRGSQKAFPFQSYPMYSSYHGVGEHLAVELTVRAKSALGEDLVLSSSDIFPEIRDQTLRFFILQRYFIEPILFDNRAEVSRRLEHYSKQTGQHIVQVRLESSPFVVTREGARPAQPEILKVLNLQPQ